MMRFNRKEKLQNVLGAIRRLDVFSSEVAKESCRDAYPAYVTKVIKKLAKDGHLQVVERESTPVYQWVRREEVDMWIDRQLHGEQIKQSPEQDRPREQLLKQGATNLSDSELIAILIRVGVVGESAVQAGRKVSNRFAGLRLCQLPDATIHDLKGISSAIRKDSYSQIMAGIELGRRIAMLRDTCPVERERISCSADAINYCMRAFRRLAIDATQEEFHIVSLDTQNGPINQHCITVGTLDSSLVHPREVFRPAIRDAAASVLLVHNHPSGDPTPSREDFSVTKRLKQAGDVVGIRVLDHIIVARESCRSIITEC